MIRTFFVATLVAALSLSSNSRAQPPLPFSPPKLPTRQAKDTGRPDLAKLLQACLEGAEQDRLAAFDRLEELAGSAEAKLQALKESLDSDSEAIRLRALQSIGQQDEKDPQVVTKLKGIIASGENPLEKLLASRATLRMTDDESLRAKLAKSLAESLASTDSAIANQAALALREAGPLAESELLTVLDAPTAATRSLAAESLSGTKSPEAISKLQSLLKDEDSGVRAAALIGLRAADPSPSIVSSLSEVVRNDSNPAVRARAAHVLARSNPNALSQVNSTLRENPLLGLAAVRGLAESSLGAKAKAEMLGEALAGADPEVAAAITEQLVELGDEGAAVLTASLKDETSRYWAAIGLSDFGAKAGDAVDDLIQVLDSSTPDAQTEILLALASIKPPASSVSSEITKQLGSDNAAVRYAASLAALRIGLDDAEAEAALQKNTRSEDNMLTVVSLFALAKLNPESPRAGLRAMKALGEAIASRDKRLSQLAALAMQELKPDR